jgi:flavin-dependent dehydrogenase
MGHRVLLLEREYFPRHHIGESMIAASLDVLAEIGLEDKLAAAEFPVKSGGCFMWGPSPLPWCIRFDEIPGRPTSYQVKRATFDQILLEHAASLGVEVRQGHRVGEVLTEDGRVAGVRFESPDGASHEGFAPYTVDASGLTALIANRLSRRIPAEDLKNMCLYGYWQGEHPLPAKLGGEIRPTDRNNIIIKMLADGWLWFIPLGKGLISVGFVAPRQNLPERGGKAALETFYLDHVRSTPEWSYLLGNSGYTGEFHTIKDWSYRSESMTGPGYFAVGDAACFVDPILSSGAYLAILYAKMAAVGINTLLRFPSREALVREWYEGLYGDTYTDYLTMARFWYHGSRKVGAWMGQAQAALGQEAETVFADSGREAFLGLATGNAHAHPNYVLLRELGAFPLPLHLRKDPRGHYMKEARAALFGHADHEAHDPAHREEIAAARMMMEQDPAVRKRVLEVVRSDGASYVERFSPRQAATAPPDRKARLALAPRARLSLEIVDDLVTMVAHAPGGERRVIHDDEREAIAARIGGTPGIPADRDGDGILRELVEAGVLVPARE